MTSNKRKMVSDSMGELEVDAQALYGAQTQRALNNFPISGYTMPLEFIKALLQIKRAAALGNKKLDCLPDEISSAIDVACVSLLNDPNLIEHFPVDVFQTGSGTSSNMNVNEVVATLASNASGLTVNPNDHVNFGQSSNDVIPTAIHVSAVMTVTRELLPVIDELISVISLKSETLQGVYKTGRTHLMDAMPVRMDQVLNGWAAQAENARALISSTIAHMHYVAIGGTAVGTGINTHRNFSAAVTQILSKNVGLHFCPAKEHFSLISSQDSAVALSGQLKTLAVALLKISNDLRWMNSGPLAGLGEISLEPLQPGSSIMPGKVNPVIPEAVAMVAAQVIGNDSAITVAGQSGNFELNVMLPLIAYNLLDSVTLLSRSVPLLANKAIATFEVNKDNLNSTLHRNPILVTALNPIIGYDNAAGIAKSAYRDNRSIIDVAEESTDLSREELLSLLDPLELTEGGIK